LAFKASKKLEEKSPALKREGPVLQNYIFFRLLFTFLGSFRTPILKDFTFNKIYSVGHTPEISVAGPGCLSPDPNFFHPGSRVKRVLASASKNLSFSTQKIVSKLSEI
jgi:hypothetical protein